MLLVHKLARILEDKELVKKETDHSRLVGGGVTKLLDVYRSQYYGPSFRETKKRYCESCCKET